MSTASPITILVVDDEPDLCEILAFDLTHAGFQVICAEGGHQAYEIVSKQKIDVIVSDVRMPAGNGIELLDRVKDLEREKPLVLFITAYSDLSVDQFYERGADALFHKPVDPAALVAAIHRVLEPLKARWAQKKASLGISSFDIAVPKTSSSVFKIGRGGVFVPLPDGRSLPKAKDEVAFSLQVPGHLDGQPERLEGVGIVRWVRAEAQGPLQRGFGLEFTYLSEPCREAVVAWLSAIKPREFIPQS